MTRPTDIRITDAVCSVRQIDYRTPIKFGGRVVNDATVLDVKVEVQSRDGQRGTGTGSMPLGNVWAWPSQTVSAEQTLKAMVALGERAVSVAGECPLVAHPLEISHALSAELEASASTVRQEMQIGESIPLLAQLVAASPVEAAIYDAYGKTLATNSYNLLGREFVNSDLATYLTDEFAGEYLDRYTLRQPKTRMPLYHLVGALDPLAAGDVAVPVNDGLPETLGEWILADGLTHLKIKLSGDDLKWDVERVVAVEQVAAQTQADRGCSQWCYSLDFNEKCANVEYVLEFLAQIEQRSADAFRRAQYIEQPTHRDLRANPENRMHEAAKIKPVVIDESLIDFESLQLARHLGYSGVALKACKGQSEALLMGAAAQKYGLFLCVQDLTCIGASFLHSASLASRIPTVAAIEGNGRQFCPAGNVGWDQRYPGMFEINDGTVESGLLVGPGLY
jgi:L-alanine-DL-glutamate epimerase-like enolase superfamily enzyme